MKRELKILLSAAALLCSALTGALLCSFVNSTDLSVATRFWFSLPGAVTPTFVLALVMALFREKK